VLKLRIENFDQLPDGGPIDFSADRRGFDFGRDQHLDWTLPDQSGVISRKHCEVRFFEQSYWLFDLSTNGTFVNKSPKRVQSPHKLMDGDEIRIGDYVISVAVPSAQIQTSAAFEIAAPVAAPARGGNIWDSGEASAPPIDPRDLMPPQPEIRRAPDFLHQVVHLPPVADTSPASKPIPAFAAPAAAADIWGQPSGPSPMAPPPPVEMPVVAVELPFQPMAPMYADTPVAPQAVVNPVPAQPFVPTSSDGGSFLSRLAKGAGLPSDAFNTRNEGEVAEDVGQLLNLLCGHLMQLLNARAAAKTLSRSGNRTLIQAKENNPLKFMPTPEEALRIILGPASASYLNGKQTVESSFADLKTHQVATLSAMQQAATKLFEELSPEAIKKVSDGGKKSLLSTGKGKYWDTYADTWAAKTSGKEHDMLTVFLEAFAYYYDQDSKPKK
jgi:type VI secretion system protein ImpI